MDCGHRGRATAAAKDPQARRPWPSLPTERMPTATRSTSPAEQAKDALKAIGKAADTDFNQFALAQVVVHQARPAVVASDLEAEPPQGHRERLQPGDHLADPQVLPAGPARPGADGALGLVHVGHGGQRDGLQHRLDLRPLPGLHRPQPQRCALYVDGPGGHGRRASS